MLEKIEDWRVIDLTQQDNSRFELTLLINRRPRSFHVTYHNLAVPGLTVEAGLRPLLINHPPAAQHLISLIQQVLAGEPNALPHALPVWQETAQELQAA